MKRCESANLAKGRGHEWPRTHTPANTATILSINAGAAPNTFCVSLQWEGNHDISDFHLQRFGMVLQIQDESLHSGRAIIERPFHVAIGFGLPGLAGIDETPYPLRPGDTIPLRPDLEVERNFGGNL
jgi:hypothetical protein